jgi:hypothetical protein
MKQQRKKKKNRTWVIGRPGSGWVNLGIEQGMGPLQRKRKNEKKRKKTKMKRKEGSDEK